MTTAEIREIFTIAREHKVVRFKLGDMEVQFSELSYAGEAPKSAEETETIIEREQRLAADKKQAEDLLFWSNQRK